MLEWLSDLETRLDIGDRMKYIIKSGKKDISKLVKKKIVNKLGRNQTVWVLPGDVKYLRPPIKMTEEPAVSKKIRLLGLNFQLKKYQEEMKKKGMVTLLGQKIETPEKLAALAEIYRNPYYETLRIIMVNDDNKVVGITSISSHEPNTSHALLGQDFDEGARNLKGRMDAIGATKYWLVHNHPSGNSEASEPDRRVTAGYAFRIPGFQGHVITNHKVYHQLKVTDIDRIKESAQVDEFPIVMYQQVNIDPLLNNPMKPHQALGAMLNGQMDVIHVALSTNFDKKNCTIAFVRTATSKVNAVLEIPNEYFQSKDEAKLDRFFKNLRMLGGGELILVGNPDIIRGDAVNRAFNKGHLLDGVTWGGDSLVNDFGVQNVKELNVAVKEESVGGKSTYQRFVVKPT